MMWDRLMLSLERLALGLTLALVLVALILPTWHTVMGAVAVVVVLRWGWRRHRVLTP